MIVFALIFLVGFILLIAGIVYAIFSPNFVISVGVAVFGLVLLVTGVIGSSKDKKNYIKIPMEKKITTSILDSDQQKHRMPINTEGESNPDISDFKLFLDIKNKIWKIGNKEFPVIENISNEKLKWFEETMEWASKVEGTNKITQEEAEKVDEEWWERLCNVALGTDVKTVMDSKCTEDDFRKFMAELWIFSSVEKTIEKSKQNPLYDPKVKLFISGGLIESDLQDNFARFNPYEMEDLVGKLFERIGYNVTITKRSADGGVDVIAKDDSKGEKLYISVKHWNNNVGDPEVRDIVGSAHLEHANKAILVSTKSNFTNQALERATVDNYFLELWDSNKFKEELRHKFLK